MARKSLAAFSARDIATEEFEAVTEYQHELATEAYKAQDAETRIAIDKLVHVLKQYSTGSKLNTSADMIDKALFVVAVEVVKDLALLDLRVEGFVFPQDACVKCGEEV